MTRKSKSEVETELKIRLSPQDLEKVFRTLIKKGSTGAVSHKFLPRMYYDTSRMHLYKSGISLRVQYKPGDAGRIGSYEQTVKVELKPSAALAKGVLLRKECKNDIQGHKPNLATVVDRQAKKVVTPFKNKKLMHIFTAAIERRFFDWNLKKGKKKGMVEVAFDVGKIILPSGNRHRDFSEIEVEIKKGGVEFIDIVKAKILKIAPSAKIQSQSKSQQGSKFYLKYQK
jgi:inorganic triphosphatase YgiF